jgi:DNA-binding CsgD family transcriptional regulator
MDALPPRQREIVDLACRRDLTAKGIGAVLGIAPDTVKNHKTAIMRRLGCQTMHAVCRLYGQWEERQAASEVGRALRDGRAMRASEV